MQLQQSCQGAFNTFHHCAEHAARANLSNSHGKDRLPPYPALFGSISRGGALSFRAVRETENGLVTWSSGFEVEFQVSKRSGAKDFHLHVMTYSVYNVPTFILPTEFRWSYASTIVYRAQCCNSTGDTRCVHHEGMGVQVQSRRRVDVFPPRHVPHC